MSDTDRFRKLVEKARKLQAELAPIAGEMQKMAMEMTQKIVTEAFPESEVLTIRAVSSITPTDYAKSANEAVGLLRENKIEPKYIIVDTARCIVTLGIDPPAAPKKKRR